MTREFELLLQLYSCAARGQTYSGELSDEDKSRVMFLAAHAACSGMIMLAFSQYGKSVGRLDPRADRYVKTALLASCTKNAAVSKLIGELADESINSYLIKGRAVAEYYAVPECRESSDTDILVDIECEQAAYDVMRRLGYRVVPRTEYSHHATAVSDAAGVVELHTSLFFDMLNDVLFDGCDITTLMCENGIEKRDDEGNIEYTTLGYTDHLIFLSLHMVQHFIRSGTSVRQLYDILIYTESNKDKIDFNRYFRIMDNTGYKKLIYTVYSFGIKYMGFSKESLPEFEMSEDSLTERFGNDLESGGWIGKSRDDGEELFRYYGSTRARDKDEYKRYIKSAQRRKMTSSLFPNRERLKARFGFAEHTVLLPVAWICWLVYGVKLYLKGELKSGISDKDLSEEQKKRLELFSQLEL